MTHHVVVVGDGPTGLSAALFLAKNDVPVTVLGYGETPVRKAHLLNVLGIEDVDGPAFLERARQQVEARGGELRQGWVERIEAGETIRAHLQDGGGIVEGDYLVLATGFDADVAGSLGLAQGAHGIQVDRQGRTSNERVYAGGGLVRGTKTQVATSVGDGAAIALDILSRIKGKDVHDWDVLKQPQRTTAVR